jgi:hypothetical protein
MKIELVSLELCHLFAVYDEAGEEIMLLPLDQDVVDQLDAYFYERQWHRTAGLTYKKWRRGSMLRVEKIGGGSWCAYRGSEVLVGKDKRLRLFESAEEAQHAADLHTRDRESGVALVDDGLFWYTSPDEEYDDDLADAA